ncbi:MAG: hypothetical protein COX80_04890 [Candidatus Magasanikbacteria bacterium CG_4_10_14_0_2_um_filter_33_14]|uniref:Uncharacterized protein n=1 Tax=Candidatus Magasanikbacteria bacterium CG_4_10_14_0_2_um_filter_33_14 TaxID=1974636 RepID=A0A2M7V8X8_9BACT|nr:MAG: hypothetical protein COX80_04890 [Candidatus Magasanikbacteria bacterium CG_4_10_14_0_2_um_filter_33_14]
MVQQSILSLASRTDIVLVNVVGRVYVFDFLVSEEERVWSEFATLGGFVTDELADFTIVDMPNPSFLGSLAHLVHLIISELTIMVSLLHREVLLVARVVEV